MSRNTTATIYGNLRRQIIPIATSEQVCVSAWKRRRSNITCEP